MLNNNNLSKFFESLFGFSSFGMDFTEDETEKTIETTIKDGIECKREITKSKDGSFFYEKITFGNQKEVKPKPSLKELKELESQAVAESRYEDAIKFRDEIKELEGK